MLNPNNFSDDFLTGKRKLGDPAADNFVCETFKDPAKKKELQEWLSTAKSNDQLTLLKDTFPDISFISDAGNLPLWADRKLMKAGSAFFTRHAETIMSLLGLLSLPYCYTAANGAMVLYFSERMRKETTKRLYETAVFVWEVMAPDAFEPGGKAFTEIMKVRAMHAAVRYYTLNSGKWDDSWGLPINQEDMAGTNLSFSLIVIRGLRLLGFTVSYPDQLAFMHLWNLIGHLSGLDPDMIPENPKMAQLLDRRISQRQFCVSPHGVELTQSLTDHIISINTSKASPGEILGLMRYLLGTEVADMLSIDVPDLPGYKLSLLRTVNLIKSLKPKGNPYYEYHKAYNTFKSRQPGDPDQILSIPEN